LGDSKLTIGLVLTLIFSFLVLFVGSEWIRKTAGQSDFEKI